MPTRFRTPLLLVSGFILVSVFLFINFRIRSGPTADLNLPDNIPASEATQQQTPSAQASPAPIDAIDAERQNLLQTLPPSLVNAGRPAKLDVDENGNLIVNIKVRNFFDFYLSATGEEPDEILIKRIKLDLETLPPAARDRALEILEGYIGFRQAANDYLQQLSPDLTQGTNRSLSKEDRDQLRRDALAYKRKIRAIRLHYMDAETIDAFFHDEDQYDEYVEGLYQLEDDTSLTDSQREFEREQLLTRMPDWFQRQERAKASVRQLRGLDEQDLTPQELAQKRIEIVGPEAAARLETLDQQRKAWSTRVENYNNKREALAEIFGSTETQSYQRELQKLQQENFTPEELIRIQAQELWRQEKSAQEN